MIAYYSIVQWCPDLQRKEVANIGVVIFAPGVAQHAKFSETFDRVERFFGECNHEFLEYAAKSFSSRFFRAAEDWDCRADMDKFRRCLGNNVTMATIGTLLTEDTEQSIEDLFLRLVEAP